MKVTSPFFTKSSYGLTWKTSILQQKNNYSIYCKKRSLEKAHLDNKGDTIMCFKKSEYILNKYWN